MTDQSQTYHAGHFANGAFDWQGEWVRMNVDLSGLGRKIGDELRRAAAGIDFEGLREEIDRTLQTMAEEMQKASAEWSAAESPSDPVSVHINVQAGAKPSDSARARRATEKEELMLVLNLVAAGKITPEEGARLIEALSR